MIGNKLPGLRGQNMRGVRPKTTVSTYSFPPGSYTWTCPRSGRWRFVLWGGGGTGNSGSGQHGGSGAYYEAERNLVKGQGVVVSVGASDQNTSVAMPNGELLTANGGSLNTAATASPTVGTDIAYAGSAPGVAGLGPGGGAARSGGVNCRP